MSKVTIKLPSLTAQQQLIAQSTATLNVVSGGLQSGKTTLGLDILLAHKRGAIYGNPVAYLLPDEEAVEAAKRRVYGMIQPLVTGRLDRNRINVGTRGSIQFFAMDKRFDLWDQYSIVVVDDAVRMDHLSDAWHDAIEALLSRYKGQAWVFSKPRGMYNDFSRLAQIAAEKHESGALFFMPSDSNPHCDQEAVERDRANMDADVFAQERLGEFVLRPIELTAEQSIIGRDETFRDWCLRLAASGLQVDDMPFTLENRPAMWFVYDQIPATIEQAFGQTVVMMKCTQVGFTIMEMLAMIYLAIKFMPAKIGMYLPDMTLASVKSGVRFMPILRTIPDAYRLMVENDATGRKSGEGNVLVRLMGRSRFHFLWTSGKGATESIPLDILSLDEVQEMAKADIEKTKERLSGSRIKFILAGSTANWPDEDIHWLYKKGTMHQFHTGCPSCGVAEPLDSYFPACIKFDTAKRDYRYVCKHCDGWIDDAQSGGWIPQAGTYDADRGRWVDDDGKVIPVSLHFPQFLSPTITPREIMEKYYNADDIKNFYNRVLGKPYTDPSQVPVNLEMLNACAALGMQMGVLWKDRAQGTYMGIDQMGNYNVVLIAERLPSGHMAIIHAEEILTVPTPANPEASPFDRCDALMTQFGVAVCVLETLPNYNDAKRFANRHPGKVFLAGYADMKEDMLRWGDAGATKSEKRTDEDDRDRHTVILDQYKCMQVAMKRIQNKITVFPNPATLVQEVYEKGTKGELVRIPLLKDRVFFHFTRTALIVEKDDEQHKFRRKVVKVGIDPHFSYAFMLLNVAWARAHGTTMFLFPEAERKPVTLAGGAQVASPLIETIQEQRAEIARMGTCGACISFNREAGRCDERDLRVEASDVACPMFLEA